MPDAEKVMIVTTCDNCGTGISVRVDHYGAIQLLDIVHHDWSCPWCGSTYEIEGEWEEEE